jgi:cyclic beta-1,2-glucan synthetase
VLLQTVARIVFSDTAETLAEQVDRRVSSGRASDLPGARQQALAEPVIRCRLRERIFCNGLGGFTPDGHEYVVTLEPGQTTPAPWVNVIASPHIGTVVSESGSAYTWVENAHEFRLTTWHNDPLSDASGEAFYLRDEETGAFWSPTPLPARGRSGYVCRHGFGYSVFEHYEAGIARSCGHLRRHGRAGEVRRGQAAQPLDARAQPVADRLLGAGARRVAARQPDAHRHRNRPHSGALFARNAYGRECANRVVFAHVSERERSVSGNRHEFIGRNGSLANPAAMRRKRLSGRTGAGLDPCAAIQARIELAAGQEREIVFVFGAARNADEARQLIQRFGGSGGRAAGAGSGVGILEPHPGRGARGHARSRAQRAGQRLAGVPDAVVPAVGRSGYYQSGGAYGFRDQLQDTMALIHATPGSPASS